MSNRSLFADTTYYFGCDGNFSANECERFGMTWGCKPDCPVFERGDCKDVAYENIEMFIAHDEIDKEEAIELIELYNSKLSDGQKCKLETVLKTL